MNLPAHYPHLTVLTGHNMDRLRDMEDKSVQCIVTSPPYWQLRSYLPADHPLKEHEFGSEPSPEAFVARLVELFRELRRVLRDDGTVWLNLGDSYAGSNCGGDSGKSGLQRSTTSQDESKKAKAGQRIGHRSSFRRDRMPRQDPPHKYAEGVKKKELVGIPWRVALALQADGWFLRQDIIWHKPNPMPESVRDRPTKSHEYIFLLTKRAKYFYDGEAIREGVSEKTHPRSAAPETDLTLELIPRAPGEVKNRGINPKARMSGGTGSKQNASFAAATNGTVRSRNRRSVWTVTTSPFKGAHFATFPAELIRPCILAGTSAAGCCVRCGAPLQRVVKKGEANLAQQRACGGDEHGEYHGRNRKDYEAHQAQPASTVKARILAGMRERITTGWKRTCRCATDEVMPCVVLDPFGGSGTVGQVSLEEGRSAVLCELNPEYHPMIARRCGATAAVKVVKEDATLFQEAL